MFCILHIYKVYIKCKISLFEYFVTKLYIFFNTAILSRLHSSQVYVVKEANEGYVYLINSHDTSKVILVKREKFKNILMDVIYVLSPVKIFNKLCVKIFLL